MKKKVQSFGQFSWLRRLLLRFGLDTKTTPFEPEELALLSNILGIEARDCDVPSSGARDNETEKALLNAAYGMRVEKKAVLQQRVREELSHRRQAVGVVVAIVAAIAASYSASSSSRSAATAQAAVNIILKR